MLPIALIAALLAAPDVSGTYRIETSKLVKVHKGETGHARVEVVPRPDAPISPTVSAGQSVKPAKEKLGRTDAKETTAKGVEFDVPFTAQAAGKDQLRATLSFFICTEKLCEKQKRELAL